MTLARTLTRAAFTLGFAAPCLRAQVGVTPEHSPYRDLEFRQEWTTFAGYFNARHDPAGAGPQGGVMVGERYAFRMGGPAYFTVRMAGSLQHRTIVNPQLPLATRRRKSETLPLIYADAGIELQLTGAKSWHSFAPLLNGGFGVTGDLKGARDVGGFVFGYPFTFTFGAALKYLPRRGFNARLDWSNYTYRLHYPEAYYVKSTSDPAVLDASVKKDLWRRNNVWTLGLTVLNFR